MIYSDKIKQKIIRICYMTKFRYTNEFLTVEWGCEKVKKSISFHRNN